MKKKRRTRDFTGPPTTGKPELVLGHRLTVCTALTLAFTVVLAFGRTAAALAFTRILALTGVLVFLALGGFLAGISSFVAAGVLGHRAGGGSSHKSGQGSAHQQCSHRLRHLYNSFLVFFTFYEWSLDWSQAGSRPPETLAGKSRTTTDLLTAYILTAYHSSGAAKRTNARYGILDVRRILTRNYADLLGNMQQKGVAPE